MLSSEARLHFRCTVGKIYFCGNKRVWWLEKLWNQADLALRLWESSALCFSISQTLSFPLCKMGMLELSNSPGVCDLK